MTKSASSPKPRSDRTSKKAYSAFFTGRREKWLPLFQRLVIRTSRLRGLELAVFRSGIEIRFTRDRPVGVERNDRIGRVGMIHADTRGLKISLLLPDNQRPHSRLKATPGARTRWTHQVRVREVSDIDEQLLGWISAAAHRVRISRRQSSSN